MGCTPISAGCQNCYALDLIKRFAGLKGWPESCDHVAAFPERYDQPLRWREPSAVFVCSMGDLFHLDVPVIELDAIFAAMILASQHIFMILTKRPERMRQYINDMLQARRNIGSAAAYKLGRGAMAAMAAAQLAVGRELPSHIWVGVTAENQKQADGRIPLLLDIPAAVRFVSVEPMLGAVDLTQMPNGTFPPYSVLQGWTDGKCVTSVNWLICGGESGTHARYMNPDWARSLRDQCNTADVPFFMKQMSGRTKVEREAIPADLAVREWPQQAVNAWNRRAE
jgi:protein gp37